NHNHGHTAPVRSPGAPSPAANGTTRYPSAPTLPRAQPTDKAPERQPQEQQAPSRQGRCRSDLHVGTQEQPSPSTPATAVPPLAAGNAKPIESVDNEANFRRDPLSSPNRDLSSRRQLSRLARNGLTH